MPWGQCPFLRGTVATLRRFMPLGQCFTISIPGPGPQAISLSLNRVKTVLAPTLSNPRHPNFQLRNFQLSQVMKSSEKDTEFPEDQKARLKELIPAYEAFILANNPDHKSRCDALTKWRTETAQTLIQEDLFQRLISDSGLEMKDWEKVCFCSSSGLLS